MLIQFSAMGPQTQCPAAGSHQSRVPLKFEAKITGFGKQKP
jgi:hypothetical protein